jgi:hypothetical protein
VSEVYAGKQFVGMDVHRRRSVLVRMTEAGERLEAVRISNDPEYLPGGDGSRWGGTGGGAGSDVWVVLGGGYAG